MIQDDNLKANYLVNFIEFVDWHRIEGGREQVTIGVLGAPAVAKKLAAIAEQRRRDSRGHVFRVIDTPTDSDLSEIDVLYVGRGLEEAWAELAKLAEAHHFLMVGQGDDFLREAGVIEFVSVRNHLRFSINHTRARDLNIALSSKLLKLAVEVQ